MFGKRLGGFLLGLVLGVIPLLNALVCVVFAFTQKKKRLGIYSIVLGVATAGSLAMLEHVNGGALYVCNLLFALGYMGSLGMSIVLGLNAFVTAEDHNNRANVTVFIPDETIVPDVNINTAGEKDLIQLPGINLILAKAIIDERRRNGYFADVFDLEQRMGFTPALMSNLMLTTSFTVNGMNLQPERREAPAPRDDKGKEIGPGKGRVIEF
ncbi:ComEA family DNA-binding protein [Chitinophaga varians]|uniref:ComEA family DNA-binding protein n=1 Tax=Chitinophaga varians TaxID=2202339 RepID=UPI00165ED970|nr:helix-hairpin-helix domain-containing protein [Chitinophaga varians]MBC9911688.1 helix-hairpin-helix domain-containing protein [Chitinophaga varians]